MASILIIDDDPEMRTFLAEVVTSAGHAASVAGNGEEGLRLLRKNAPDLVITDIVMPKRDGFEVLLGLHSQKPSPKTIAISGTPADWTVLKSAKDLGAHETLAKPFTRSDLLELIGVVLAGD
jgi:DNA-binding response OmpR family regulator